MTTYTREQVLGWSMREALRFYDVHKRGRDYYLMNPVREFWKLVKRQAEPASVKSALVYRDDEQLVFPFREFQQRADVLGDVGLPSGEALLSASSEVVVEQMVDVYDELLWRGMTVPALVAPRECRASYGVSCLVDYFVEAFIEAHGDERAADVLPFFVSYMAWQQRAVLLERLCVERLRVRFGDEVRWADASLEENDIDVYLGVAPVSVKNRMAFSVDTFANYRTRVDADRRLIGRSRVKPVLYMSENLRTARIRDEFAGQKGWQLKDRSKWLVLPRNSTRGNADALVAAAEHNGWLDMNDGD